MPAGTEEAIRDRLVQLARAASAEDFTSNADANALLSDLTRYPHAFVLGCLMDRQVDSEKAWLLPWLLSERMREAGSGEFSIANLSRLSLEAITSLMTAPFPLHRFPANMAKIVHAAVRRIGGEYGGDAAAIWKGRPSSAEAVYRFLGFDGAGQKIATMAVNILARDFKVEFAELSSIDISADVQVRRVFGCLGLCPPDPSIEQVIYKARALYPEYPGFLDLPCWRIGQEVCRPANPLCGSCAMRDICPTAAGMHASRASA